MIEPDHSLLNGMLMALGVLILLSLVSTLLYLRRMDQRIDTRMRRLSTHLESPTGSSQRTSRCGHYQARHHPQKKTFHKPGFYHT